MDVGVQAEESEGELSADVLEGLEDVHLGHVFQGSRLHPGCGNIGEREGLAGVPKGYSPVVGNEVGFTEARSRIAPVRECSHWDMVFEETARASPTAALHACKGLGLDQEPVSNCWTDRKELLAGGTHCPAMARDEEDPSRAPVQNLDMSPSAATQHEGSVTAGVARQMGDLIQSLGPLLLRRVLEVWSLLSIEPYMRHQLYFE